MEVLKHAHEVAPVFGDLENEVVEHGTHVLEAAGHPGLVKRQADALVGNAQGGRQIETVALERGVYGVDAVPGRNGTLSSVVAQDTTEVVLPNPADVTTVVNGQAMACESRSLTRGRASTFEGGDGMVTFDGRRTNRPDSPSLLSSPPRPFPPLLPRRPRHARLRSDGPIVAKPGPA